MGPLHKQTCAPCEGGTPPLSDTRIAELLPQVPGWQLEDGKLTRAIDCGNFKNACALFVKVALLCEEERHHADFRLTSWKRLEFVLSTHAISGLSDNDFIVAAKINRLLGE